MWKMYEKIQNEHHELALVCDMTDEQPLEIKGLQGLSSAL